MNFVQVYKKSVFWSPLDFRVATKGLCIWNIIIPIIQVRKLKFSSMKSIQGHTESDRASVRTQSASAQPIARDHLSLTATFMWQEIKYSNMPYFPATWETSHGWHSHSFLMGVINTHSYKLVGQSAYGNTFSKRWVKPNSTHVWGGEEKGVRLSHSC